VEGHVEEVEGHVEEMRGREGDGAIKWKETEQRRRARRRGYQKVMHGKVSKERLKRLSSSTWAVL